MSITGIAGMINITRLTPRLLPPAEIFAGTPATFRLQIRNTKRYIPSFLIRLTPPDGHGVTLPLVPNNRVTDASLTLTFADRGWGTVGRITVSSPFPVNFFTRSWSIPIEDRCIVFPRPLPVNIAGYGSEASVQGNSSQRGRGLDGELERIADYSGCEPLRMIHWKHSARVDDLLVKEFGRLSAPPLMIDLDTMPGRMLEERISHAAWLVRHWVSHRPVGLRLGERSIPPAAGQRHSTHLLTELALYGN